MKKNLNNNLVSGAAIRDGKGKNIARQFSDIVTGATPVAYANKLIMPTAPTDQEFTYRTTGGENQVEDGVAKIESIKGNTLVWNQLLKRNYSTDRTMDGVKLLHDGYSYKMQGVANGSNGYTIANGYGKVEGHKYIMIAYFIKRTAQTKLFWGDDYNSPFIYTNDTYYRIRVASTYGNQIIIAIENGKEYDEEFMFQVHDLTAMFGPGNEPTTIEEFEARKPKVADEYAYNEGELISNTAEQIKSVGFNLWDEEWTNGYYKQSDGTFSISSDNNVCCKELVKVLSGKKYNSTELISVKFYDNNKNYIGYSGNYTRTFTTPNNCSFIAFNLQNTYGTTYKNDICISLSNPLTDGTYRPYQERVLTLPKVAELFPDGLKSAGQAYDEITPKKAIKRTEKVKIKDLPWYYNKTTDCFATEVIGRKPTSKFIPGKFELSLKTSGWNAENKCFAISTNAYIYFKFEGITDTSALNAEFGEAELVYELAEPVEVEFENELNLAYDIEAGGTEEAIYPEGTPGAPFKASMGYAIDAASTIAKNKETIASLTQRVTALEQAIINQQNQE